MKAPWRRRAGEGEGWKPTQTKDLKTTCKAQLCHYPRSGRKPAGLVPSARMRHAGLSILGPVSRPKRSGASRRSRRSGWRERREGRIRAGVRRPRQRQSATLNPSGVFFHA